MERKIATQLTDKVKAFAELKTEAKFHFMGTVPLLILYDKYMGFRLDVDKLDGYQLVSEQEFLDYFKEEDESIPERMIEDIRRGMLYPNEFYEPKIKFEKPIHYAQTKSGMDVFDVARDWEITSPELFSALKYILRCGKKDSKTMEITKAVNCLNKYLKVLEDEQVTTERPERTK